MLERVGRYRIDQPLGAGGMGDVFRAHDDELGRDVALKFLREAGDETAVARFRREARAACAFQHPNAATVFDVGVHEGRPFIVMELVRGESLRTKIADPEVTVADKVAWLRQIAAALGAAHDAGLVHRDIKPDNVVIGEDGAAKVLDFGIARRRAVATVDASAPTAAEETLTADGTALGTPAYMSPEQIRGLEVDGRSDQFSWGATAFELFANALPWATTSSAFAVAASILHEPHRDLAALAPKAPRSVIATIERALSKSPEDRFATMKDAAAALEGDADDGAPGPVESTGDTDVVAAAGVKSAAAPSTAGRAPPWGIVLGAGLIALASYWVYGLIVTPIPPRPKLMGSGPRGAILGLDDAATRKREAELDASQPRVVLPSAIPSSVIEGSRAFGRKCTDEESKTKKCAADNDAWCDSEGKPIGCCMHGLAATPDGHCLCPPGGSTEKAAVDSGCAAADPGYAPSIQATVRANFDRLRACYEAALARNGKLKGTIAVTFRIDYDGAVTFAELAGAGVPDAELQTCMVDEFKKLRFGPPPNAGINVTYPIVFGPGDDPPPKQK